MSLYYSHLLIARDKEFSAAPAQVEAFCRALDSLGVVPPPLTVTLFTESDRFRTVQNPFTGKITLSARPTATPCRASTHFQRR
ncbi:MAG: hypothetical protein U0836_18770 [Pirellulales bacterium]